MRTTRRAYLAAAGGAVTATAGCLGGGSGTAGMADLSCDVGQLDQVNSLPRPSLGPDDAAVTVSAYEDYACPHCATYSLNVFPKVKENYIDTGKIRYRFFDFPLPVNEQWSWGGAVAARAVQDRADAETFFEYGKTLFERQGDLTSEGYSVVHDAAEEFDVNGCEVAASVDQETYKSVVESDRQRAVDAGFQSTPTIVVNGETTADPSWSTVKQAIDGHLKSASKS
ncbi:protein-disulfide isomerase [Halogeometricum pallidum JCM 14848]|uniref:Protein-disulfide isomerase n=1 Tax=Halogeometricum pallidum JCM 14848 TaxID=1227487 RepID=M0CUV9_HALPD|nr:thioredoxin domain-containing protein [Halogeometricum pallidum]ELZ26207.1 protein-disulfide isomerase [Halogeometricum pallidum JCM 14848]